jgi:hypothetical protein
MPSLFFDVFAFHIVCFGRGSCFLSFYAQSRVKIMIFLSPEKMFGRWRA